MTTKEEILAKFEKEFHYKGEGHWFHTVNVCADPDDVDKVTGTTDTAWAVPEAFKAFLSHALDTYLEQAFREIRPEDVLLHIDEPLGDNIGVPEEWGTGYNTALSDLDTNYKRFKGDQT